MTVDAPNVSLFRQMLLLFDAAILLGRWITHCLCCSTTNTPGECQAIQEHE
jgi:hypothetical protein